MECLKLISPWGANREYEIVCQSANQLLNDDAESDIVDNTGIDGDDGDEIMMIMIIMMRMVMMMMK